MIFKLCPICGGPVVRMRDEIGDKFLSCQNCTWTDHDKSDQEPVEPFARLPAPLHWILVVLVLLMSALLACQIFWPKR